MIYIGIDIVEYLQLAKVLINKNSHFVKKVFTLYEIEYCENSIKRVQKYSELFAIKEAVMKAVGTGWSAGIGWKQIEVIDPEQTSVRYSGKILSMIKTRRIREISYTLSSSESFTTAFVLMNT